MGRGQNDGSSLLYGEIARKRPQRGATPIQRATQIIHTTCTDPEDPSNCFSDAVCDIHHLAAHVGLDWDEALGEGRTAFERESDLHWDLERRPQSDLVDICADCRQAIDPGWDAGLSDDESRLRRAEDALAVIQTIDGTQATEPATKIARALGVLRIAAESFGFDWEVVIRKADTYYRSDVDGF